jgi:hypothetical protein
MPIAYTISVEKLEEEDPLDPGGDSNKIYQKQIG